MGKQGPCTHCGITSTPLWRNGPPDKPVLCNACGSRWRTRGTLEGYMPLHAGGLGLGLGASIPKSKPKRPPNPRPQSLPNSQRRGPSVPSGSSRRRPSASSMSVSLSDEDDMEEEGFGYGNSDFAAKSLPKGECGDVDEWQPSDGEADDMYDDDELDEVSFLKSGSHGRMGRSASTGTLAGSSAIAIPGMTSSRKRSMAPGSAPHNSHVSSYTKRSFPSTPIAISPSPASTAMAAVMQRERSVAGVAEEESMAAGLGEEEEDDLMVSNISSMVSMELGLGSLMARTPSCDTLDSYGNYSYREESSRFGGMHRVASVSSLRIGEHRETGSRGVSLGDRKQNRELLEKFPYSKRDVLRSRESPLGRVKLQDVVNCDNFYLFLSAEERVSLLQMLAPMDTARGQNSVSELFESAQFGLAMENFQNLLTAGMFEGQGDFSMLGSTWEEKTDSRQVLSLFHKVRNPLLTNLVKSNWWSSWNALSQKIAKKKLPKPSLSGSIFDETTAGFKQENSSAAKSQLSESAGPSMQWSVADPRLEKSIFSASNDSSPDTRNNAEIDISITEDASQLFLDVPMTDASNFGGPTGIMEEGGGHLLFARGSIL